MAILDYHAWASSKATKEDPQYGPLLVQLSSISSERRDTEYNSAQPFPTELSFYADLPTWMILT